jgi:hypothetical protein
VSPAKGKDVCASALMALSPSAQVYSDKPVKGDSAFFLTSALTLVATINKMNNANFIFDVTECLI